MSSDVLRRKELSAALGVGQRVRIRLAPAPGRRRLAVLDKTLATRTSVICIAADVPTLTCSRTQSASVQAMINAP
jgi:hypothetical protein